MALEEYTVLTSREIVGTGIGSSPKGVRAFEDLQRAAFEANPQDAAAAQEAANNAQTAAEAGISNAATAQEQADNAMVRADEAYDLAETKVTKDATPDWQQALGASSRVALPNYSAGTVPATYDTANEQTLRNQVQALSQAMAALVADLTSNGALKG